MRPWMPGRIMRSTKGIGTAPALAAIELYATMIGNACRR